MLGTFIKNAVSPDPKCSLRVGVAAVGVGSAANFLSLCGINPHKSKGPGSTVNVFYNQALNTTLVFGSRTLAGVKDFLVR
jgi:putative DNA methylase